MANENRPNIVLTGFIGTGKSAVAQRIATLTGREVVDMKSEMAASHSDLADMIENDGDRLQQVERDLVSSLAPRRNLVIATTSSTMLDADNVVSLLGAEVFNLSANTKEIMTRLEADGGVETRAELASSDDPQADVDRLLDERAEAYARFASIDTTGKSVDQVIDALRDAGATIEDPSVIAGGATTGSGGMDSTTRLFVYIIAAALAVLVVLLFLVLSF